MSLKFDSAYGGHRSTEDPLAGDPELKRELAIMFLEDCPKQVSDIRASITARDGPELDFAAHRLKGSVGVFHVQTAFQAVVRMERIGKENDWEHAEEAWLTLDQEITRLSASLADFINDAP